MYLDRKRDLCFLAHPRTASRSIGAALEGIGFQKHRGHHGGPISGDDRYLDLRYFTCVRNHWDTFASWHINKTGVEKEKSIRADWVQKWIARHTSKEPFYCRPNRLFYFLVDVPGTIYIHFEHLSDDLNFLLNLWKLPKVDLPHIKDRRKKTSYQELYTDEAKDFIAWYFADEIKELGYTFEKGGPVDAYPCIDLRTTAIL